MQGIPLCDTKLFSFALLLFFQLALAVAFHPVGLVDLTRPCNGKLICLDVRGNGGTCRNIGIRSHIDRRHQVGIAADKGVVTHLAAEFAVAVVVDGDHAAADVDVRAEIGIPDVGQVRHTGLFSGRLVDRGMVTQVIEAGLYLVCFCFFGLSSCGWLTTWSLQWTTYFLFTIALLLGIGFGTMFPAYNTLFVNLAPNNQRGTATSTYLTSWDVGIGAGMLLGGYIAEIATFKMAYLFGAALTVISLFYFRSKVAPHFHRHKLR